MENTTVSREVMNELLYCTVSREIMSELLYCAYTAESHFKERLVNSLALAEENPDSDWKASIEFWKKEVEKVQILRARVLNEK